MMDTAQDLYVVSLENASIMQADTVILRNISLTVHKGEFLYLIGKTGSGKSSLLRTLYADLPLTKGKGNVVGFALENIKTKQVPFLRRKIGIVFQDFQLFTDRSIAENLLFVMEATGWQDKEKMRRRVEWVLSEVGMTRFMSHYPHQLSGGEQQRIAIARAMINSPEVIFADEPTGNLDPFIANEIHDLFIKINQSGTAIVMATHNHAFLKRHPAKVLVCDNHELKSVDKEEVAKRFKE